MSESMTRSGFLRALFHPSSILQPAQPHGSGASQRDRTVVLLPSGALSSVQIPDPDYIPESLCVYRNGLLQYDPGDYTVSGVTVSFTPGEPTPVAGDVLQIKYRTP